MVTGEAWPESGESRFDESSWPRETRQELPDVVGFVISL
jgi:hypothetical protein